MLILLLSLVVHSTSGHYGGCGFQNCVPRHYPQPHPQPTQHKQHYQWQGVPRATEGYALPPTKPKNPFGPDDKDLTTESPELGKEWEKYEEALAKLEPHTPLPVPVAPLAEELVNGSSGITYIRKLSPGPYIPRPMPYRPHPLLPKGCPVLPPHYLRPDPHMPRGYVTPLPYIHPPPTTLPPLFHPIPMQGGYYNSHYATSYHPPMNDCCGRCHAPCRYRRRSHLAHAQGSKTATDSDLDKQEAEEAEAAINPRCSNKDLKALMNKYTTKTAALTKRLIQKHAEDTFGGYFSVFCSTDDISYLSRSELFCQNTKNNIFCYAFQHR